VWGYTSVNDYRERGNDEASVHGEPVSIPAAGRQRQHGGHVGEAYQTELERPHAARPELRRRGRLAELDLDAVPPALALRAVSAYPMDRKWGETRTAGLRQKRRSFCAVVICA
jgi:hypothetical protein